LEKYPSSCTVLHIVLYPLHDLPATNHQIRKTRGLMPLVLFPHRSETAALWPFGRTGKTSGYLEEGDNCRFFPPFGPRAPHGKSNGLHTPREFFLVYEWKESIFHFITVKRNILSYTSKKASPFPDESRRCSFKPARADYVITSPSLFLFSKVGSHFLGLFVIQKTTWHCRTWTSFFDDLGDFIFR